jgi:hypothetical protein
MSIVMPPASILVSPSEAPQRLGGSAGRGVTFGCRAFQLRAEASIRTREPQSIRVDLAVLEVSNQLHALREHPPPHLFSLERCRA